MTLKITHRSWMGITVQKIYDGQGVLQWYLGSSNFERDLKLLCMWELDIKLLLWNEQTVSYPANAEICLRDLASVMSLKYLVQVANKKHSLGMNVDVVCSPFQGSLYSLGWQILVWNLRYHDNSDQICAVEGWLFKIWKAKKASLIIDSWSEFNSVTDWLDWGNLS